MKRRWVFGLSALFAAWLLSRLPFEQSPPAWAGGDACVDGDVNGDRALNITDPVHLLSFLFKGGPPPVTCSAAAKPVTAVFVLRHAEKATTPADDPPLTDAGMERAKNLAQVFKRQPVQHLISSTLLRTRQTLEPLAALPDVPDEIIQIGDLGTDSAKDVVAKIRSFPAGDVTVVCHHSTTVIPILEELGIPKTEATTIDTNAYDNLVEVLLPPGGGPQMLKLTYR